MIDSYFLSGIIFTLSIFIGTYFAITMISTGINDDDHISLYLGSFFVIAYIILFCLFSPCVADVLYNQH